MAVTTESSLMLLSNQSPAHPAISCHRQPLFHYFPPYIIDDSGRWSELNRAVSFFTCMIAWCLWDSSMSRELVIHAFYCNHSIVWLYSSLFIHFPIGGYLGCFSFWAIMNKLAMNKHRSLFVIYVFFSFG